VSSPGSYATGHGFPSYLDMHFAVLHPSTHPDVAEYHLRETDMGSARHYLTADSAPDIENEPAVLKSVSSDLP
jgi:hypothetical protein